MKDQYIEFFEINGFRADISKKIEGKNIWFRPWVGGCAIANSVKTQDEARKLIFNYFINRFNSLKMESEKKVKSFDKALNLLGTDVFNLGQFKVKS